MYKGGECSQKDKGSSVYLKYCTGLNLNFTSDVRLIRKLQQQQNICCLQRGIQWNPSFAQNSNQWHLAAVVLPLKVRTLTTIFKIFL